MAPPDPNEQTCFDPEPFTGRCPRCRKEFSLTSERVSKQGGCASDRGGYHIEIECPYCHHQEEL